MAQIDIGKIKPVFRGTYDNSTAYVLDDIVYYNGSSYVAKTSTTGNLPTDTTKWNILASGSGGIYDSTLSLGSANQILQVNSGATGLEFTAKPTGGIKQVIQTVKTNIQVISSTSNVDIMSVSITPSSSSSKILVSWNVNACSNDHADISVFRDATQIYLGDASGSRRRTAHAMYAIHGDHISEFSGTFLDSPNSNSSNTYYVKGSTPGSSSHSLMINISDRDLDRAQNHRTASNIMVMEVTV